MSLMMVQRTKILMWPTSLLKAITTFNLKMHLSDCSVTGVSQVSCQESVSVCVCVGVWLVACVRVCVCVVCVGGVVCVCVCVCVCVWVSLTTLPICQSIDKWRGSGEGSFV